MIKNLPVLFSIGLLAACTGRSGPCPIQEPNAARGAVDACHAGELQRYLRSLPTADIMAAISATVATENIRTIRPGEAVTMDFRESRLNVELGEDGRIKRLRCG